MHSSIFFKCLLAPQQSDLHLVQCIYTFSFSVCTLPNNPIYIRCDDERDEPVRQHGPDVGPEGEEKGTRQGKAIDKWFSAVGDIVGPDSVKVTRTARGVYFTADQYIEVGGSSVDWHCCVW